MKEFAWAAILAVVFLWGLPAAAQSGDGLAAESIHDGTFDLGVFAQGGKGVGERASFNFFTEGVRLGKVLTPQLGSGFLRGDFEFASEIMPLELVFMPQYLATGGGATPVILRWNFTRGRRIVPYFQAAGGILVTNRDVPPHTLNFNFAPQPDAGAHIFTRRGQAITVGVSAIHFSNASLANHNSGVNASVHIQVGYTWFK